MMDDDDTQLRRSPTGLEPEPIPLSVSATSTRILSSGKYCIWRGPSFISLSTLRSDRYRTKHFNGRHGLQPLELDGDNFIHRDCVPQVCSIAVQQPSVRSKCGVIGRAR